MRAIALSLLLALSSGSVVQAAEESLAPPLATVDDPRAARERPRVSYVLHDNGIESYVVRPRAVVASEKTTLLLAFPKEPKVRVVPAGALEGLTAAAGLDGGSPEERATLLPPAPRDVALEILGSSLDAAREWLRRQGQELDERTRARLQAALDAGWVLVGVDAPAPAPTLGFRFASEALVLPLDVLAPDDEHERLFVVSDAPVQARDKERTTETRVLVRAAFARALSADSPLMAPARTLVTDDLTAAREGRLLLYDEERRAALLDVSRRLSLSGVAVMPLLPPAPVTKAEAEEDVATHRLEERALTVLDGDLYDESKAPGETPFEPATRPDEQTAPLVRRFEDNRIFQLLQKVWD